MKSYVDTVFLKTDYFHHMWKCFLLMLFFSFLKVCKDLVCITVKIDWFKSKNLFVTFSTKYQFINDWKPTPASYGCLLLFKMTDISLISSNMRNYLLKNISKFRHNSSIFTEFIAQTTIQDFDTALWYYLITIFSVQIKVMYWKN